MIDNNVIVDLGSELNSISAITASQASNIMTKYASSKKLTLDFSDISIMGRGFADQMFRVSKLSYPDMVILATNMNNQVQMMYDHILDSLKYYGL